MEKQILKLDADSRISQIFEHKEAILIFDRFLPGMRVRVEGQSAILGFSIRKLVAYAMDMSRKNVNEINKVSDELTEIESLVFSLTK